MVAIPENLRHKKAALAGVEIVLGLIAIIILVAYNGEGEVSTADGSAHYTINVKYPFEQSTGFFADSGGSQMNQTVYFDSSVGTSARLFLVTGIITVLVAIGRLVLYMVTGETPRSQVIPPIELVVTGVMTVLVTVASCILTWQVSGELSSPLKDNIFEVYSLCINAGFVCSRLLPSYGLLYASLSFMILSALTWAVNIWYGYRNTYLHRPYYVSHMEAGEGPGAEEIPASSYGSTPSAGGLPGPREMMTIRGGAEGHVDY